MSAPERTIELTTAQHLDIALAAAAQDMSEEQLMGYVVHEYERELRCRVIGWRFQDDPEGQVHAVTRGPIR